MYYVAHTYVVCIAAALKAKGQGDTYNITGSSARAIGLIDLI